MCVLAAPALANSQKAPAARTQFTRAEKLRARLNARLPKELAPKDYRRVVEAYRRVYYLDPGSSKASASVTAVAELLAGMGHQFDDAKALRAAIGQYKFLLREYPGNPYRGLALLSMAQIYQDDLHEAGQAKAIYQQLLKEYPRSKHAEEARQALARIKPAHKQVLAKSARTRIPQPSGDDGLARVTGIRYWSTADYSRVAVDLDSDITFHSQRLQHPDRVVFDLHWTRLSPSLAKKSFEPKDGLLKNIRVSEYQPGNARLVLEGKDLGNYSAFLLPNPDRLIIDVHGHNAQEAVRTAASKALKAVPTEPDARKGAETAAGRRPEVPAPLIISDEDANPAAPDKTARRQRPPFLPPSAKRPARVVIREGGEEVEAREARPTASGDRSLIRALGLKIGKIVIDPGHGGHDTGTIGPNGLEEKDLVLDVGLRLGKLLEQRLGADVVYTRRDNTFIPLETRTAIANQAHADLFISIHANSSHNPDARGVETYYLNFTTSRDALEVAARENAVSDQSIYQLQKLVKTIALQEKVEESREFAADVQQALYTGLRNPAIHNRGVKKAPFVVLIGAKMPSILAEISFVSNPQDERKLRSPAYRERIALALYRGISRYASGLSGIRLASSAAQGDGQ